LLLADFVGLENKHSTTSFWRFRTCASWVFTERKSDDIPRRHWLLFGYSLWAFSLESL